MRKLKLAVAVALPVILMQLANSTFACTVMEFMQTYMQLNSKSLTNDDRIKIADLVVEAKKWPGVQIGANVTAGAYVKERSLD